MQQEDDLRGLAEGHGVHACHIHCFYCHSRLLVLLPIICGYGYQYRRG